MSQPPTRRGMLKKLAGASAAGIVATSGCLGVGFGAQQSTSQRCPRPVSYWRDNPDEWPATNHLTPHIHLGSNDHDSTKYPFYREDGGDSGMSVVEIFESDKTTDKTIVMAKQIAAAGLNRYDDAAFWCVRDTYEQAQQWMQDHGPVGSGQTDWAGGESLKDELEAYNDGELCGCSEP